LEADVIKLDRANILKTGAWLYDGQVAAAAYLVQDDAFYGTGDHEEEPGLQDDQPGPCYRILWEDTSEPGRITGGGGQCWTIEEALATAKNVDWTAA
jgi:hypothetical protein